MTRQDVIQLLEQHRPVDALEHRMRARILEFVRAHENCFERSLLIGHITASAWVVNPARTHALLLHHAKLDKWLQPGGHCDGSADILASALREVLEETGLTATPVSAAIYDTDAHDIPERRHEPAHVHYDIRFLVEAPFAPPVVSDESHAVEWVELGRIAERNTDASVLRLAAKTPRA